jgi:hypothetical protein
MIFLMEKDLLRENQAVPDSELFVIADLLQNDLNKLFIIQTKENPKPATILLEMTKIIDKYLERDDDGLKLKSIDQVK